VRNFLPWCEKIAKRKEKKRKEKKRKEKKRKENKYIYSFLLGALSAFSFCSFLVVLGPLPCVLYLRLGVHYTYN